MRVVLWGELFWPYIGGAELFAAQLMSSLRPRGHEFIVVTSHDYLDLPDEETFHGIPVHRFSFRTALAPAHHDNLAALRRRLSAVLQAFAPELIHINGISPSTFFCLQAARAHSIPLLLRLNRQPFEHEAGSRPGTLLEHALRRAAWVVAVSEGIAAQARRLVPEITTRSSAIYNGIDVPPEAPAPPSCDPPRLLCLGRLVHSKGIDIAIDAFVSVLRHWPRARLIIAGDGPERAALQDQAIARGIAEAVEFIGWIPPDETARIIAQATLVLIPSRTDGLPTVAIQTAAMGRPIVSTRVGGLPEAVRHGETGLLVDGSSSAMSAAIDRLLQEPDTITRMSIAAWRHAQAVFDPRRCIDAYDELYRRIGCASPGRR